MRILRAVALGGTLGSTRMMWLLQATSSRTRVPCALCHSAASQAPQVRYAELAQTFDLIEQADARLAGMLRAKGASLVRTAPLFSRSFGK